MTSIRSLIKTYQDIEWLPRGATMSLFRSSEIPQLELITSVHLFCFSGDSLLMVEHESRGWDIPGGHVEVTEGLQTALDRELFEEAGAHCNECTPFAYCEIDIGSQSIPNYKYPTPRSYICAFLGVLASFEEFPAAHETKQRRLFSAAEVRRLEWYTHHGEIFELALECRSALGV